MEGPLGAFSPNALDFLRGQVRRDVKLGGLDVSLSELGRGPA